MRFSRPVALALALAMAFAPGWRALAEGDASPTLDALRQMTDGGSRGREVILEIVRDNEGFDHLLHMPYDEVRHDVRGAGILVLPALETLLAEETEPAARARAASLAAKIMEMSTFGYNVSLDIIRVVGLEANAREKRRLLFLAEALQRQWGDWVEGVDKGLATAIWIGNMSVGIALGMFPPSRRLMRLLFQPLLKVLPRGQLSNAGAIGIIATNYLASLGLAHYIARRYIRPVPGRVLFPEASTEVLDRLERGEALTVDVWPGRPVHDGRGAPREALQMRDLIYIPSPSEEAER